jgi:hypothetical protein
MASGAFASEPLLGALLDYWERKRGAQTMPSRGDIDPLDMPPRLLPHVQLVERGEGGRLRLRLVGTAIVDAIGKDPTGRFLDDVFDADLRRFLGGLFGTAVRSRRPVVGQSWLRKAKGPDLGMRWLATPLSANGSDVTMILAAATFRSARARTLAAEAPAAEDAPEIL